MPPFAKRHEATRMPVVPISREQRDQWLAEGEKLFAEGESELAAAIFLYVARTDPTCLGAWNNLAVACESLALRPEALAACDRALQLDENSPDALANRKAILESEPRPYRLAERAAVVATSPSRADRLEPILDDVRREFLEGNFAAGFIRFFGIPHFDPKNVELWNAFGASLFTLECYVPALAAFGKALEAEPTHLGASINRTNALRKLGMQAEALVSLETCLREHPCEPEVLELFAEVHRRK